jgi:tetratricopeptide (TPR) repeat protein
MQETGMNHIDAVRAQRDKLAPLVEAALDFAKRREAPMLADDRARGDQLVATAHQASFNIAELFLRLGQINEAADLFSQTLSLGVEVGLLNARIGAIHLRNQNYVAAAAHFENAARLEPGVADHAIQLGRALFRAGKIWKAREALEAALALEPDALPALNELAAICIACRDAERAADLGQRALKLDPGNSEAQRLLDLIDA